MVRDMLVARHAREGRDAIILEKKEDMKRRGLAHPILPTPSP
jgi:hypothetical protein